MKGIGCCLSSIEANRVYIGKAMIILKKGLVCVPVSVRKHNLYGID